MKFHSAAQLVEGFTKRFPEPGTLDLQAGAEVMPTFGEPDQPIESIQAAGVLSFNTAGKLKNAKAQSHFLVGGNTVLAGDLLELPEADFKRMGPDGTGQVREATDDEVTAAQKASKK